MQLVHLRQVDISNVTENMVELEKKLSKKNQFSTRSHLSQKIWLKKKEDRMKSNKDRIYFLTGLKLSGQTGLAINRLQMEQID